MFLNQYDVIVVGAGHAGCEAAAAAARSVKNGNGRRGGSCEGAEEEGISLEDTSVLTEVLD